MSRKKPFFSVITICFNEEGNIEKTCKSVANQTFKDFEWIVIDGGSTDNTLKILNNYKGKIGFLVSEKDKGLVNAMNKGIKKSKGEYLLFLNGGDYLFDKNVLENVFKSISKDNCSSKIYYGDMKFEGREIADYSKAKVDNKFFITKTICHQSTFIHRDLFEKYGLYDESIKMVCDFEFWVRTIVKNNIIAKYIPYTVATYNLSGFTTDYKLTRNQIKERNKVLLDYKVINGLQAKFQEVKWFFFMILKILGLFFVFRKIFRRIKSR